MGGKIKIEKTEVYGFGVAMRAMRNPRSSHYRSDSVFYQESQLNNLSSDIFCVEKPLLGENDLELAKRLVLSGTEHAKFMRMIHVMADVTSTRYFWSDFDTYKFNNKLSESSIHELVNINKPISTNMFIIDKEDEEYMLGIIDKLNELREKYISATEKTEKSHLYAKLKRLLPECFLQKRTIDTNYAELRNIYFQRRNHILKEEWQDLFVGWIKRLPYAEELIMIEKKGV